MGSRPSGQIIVDGLHAKNRGGIAKGIGGRLIRLTFVDDYRLLWYEEEWHS